MPGPNLQSYKVGFAEPSSSTKQSNMVQALEDAFDTIDEDQLATKTNKAVPLTGSSLAGGFAWPDASSTSLLLWLAVPDDYVSGDLTWWLWRRGAAAGTAAMTKSSTRLRDNTAVVTIDSSVGIGFTPGDTNSHMLAMTIAAAQFQAGDIIRFLILRAGADGSDTMAASVEFDGAWVEYTGRV